ncbi:MAG: hypothetical protein J3K34DRAFT_73372 [Monoraphidium minutum]|nr:MAG: hypothetical protein J3K34DRAFT_73372 [Monoraphidium minutum]
MRRGAARPRPRQHCPPPLPAHWPAAPIARAAVTPQGPPPRATRGPTIYPTPSRRAAGALGAARPPARAPGRFCIHPCSRPPGARGRAHTSLLVTAGAGRHAPAPPTCRQTTKNAVTDQCLIHAAPSQLRPLWRGEGEEGSLRRAYAILVTGGLGTRLGTLHMSPPSPHPKPSRAAAGPGARRGGSWRAAARLGLFRLAKKGPSCDPRLKNDWYPGLRLWGLDLRDYKRPPARGPLVGAFLMLCRAFV